MRTPSTIPEGPMYGPDGALVSDDVRVRRRCPERTEDVRTCSIVGVYTGTESYEPRNMGEYLHSDGAFPTSPRDFRY